MRVRCFFQSYKNTVATSDNNAMKAMNYDAILSILHSQLCLWMPPGPVGRLGASAPEPAEEG